MSMTSVERDFSVHASPAPSGADGGAGVPRWLRSLMLASPPANFFRASGSATRVLGDTVLPHTALTLRAHLTRPDPSGRSRPSYPAVVEYSSTEQPKHSAPRANHNSDADLGAAVVQSQTTKRNGGDPSGVTRPSTRNESAPQHARVMPPSAIAVFKTPERSLTEPEAREKLAGGDRSPEGAKGTTGSHAVRAALRREREEHSPSKQPESPEIPIVVLDHSALQHLNILLLERLRPVMFFLIRHIRPDCLDMRGRNSESAIALLPRENGDLQLSVDPSRRLTLQFPHDIRKAVSRTEPSKHVYVIRNSTNCVRGSVHAFDYPTEIGMDSLAMVDRDPRFPVFRAEDQVIIQRQMGRRHPRRFSHSCRSAINLPDHDRPLRSQKIATSPAAFYRAPSSPDADAGGLVRIQSTKP